MTRPLPYAGWTCASCKSAVAGPYVKCESCGVQPQRDSDGPPKNPEIPGEDPFTPSWTRLRNRKSNLYDIFPNGSIRLGNILWNEGIDSAEKLCALTVRQLSRFPNCGRVTIREIQDGLRDVGLHLAGEGTNIPKQFPGGIILWHGSFYKRINHP